MSQVFSTTTTVQNILDAVAQDVVNGLGAESPILLDYVNRVSQQILRSERHGFLLSDVKRFVTQKGISRYWIGTSGSASAGTYDTGLNITDLGAIKHDEMKNLSLNSVPGRSSLRFAGQGFKADGSVRQGVPEQWAHQHPNGSVIELYPAPDNQNDYRPVPLAPNVTTTTSGALSARTYFVKQTFVDAEGNESTPSEAAEIYVPANKVLKVISPVVIPTASATGVSYSQYRTYIGTTEGSETRQATTNIGTAFTEPDSGLVAGNALPTENTLEPVGGYVMEFRYYKKRTALTAAGDTLQIPDDYKDVVVVGVNYMAYRFLKRWDEMREMQGEFLNGLRSITRDRNLVPYEANYLRPDPAAL